MDFKVADLSLADYGRTEITLAELNHLAKTWGGEFYKNGGGGAVWDGIAYDREANLVYVGTGNGSPWSRELRSEGRGDQLARPAGFLARESGLGHVASSGLLATHPWLSTPSSTSLPSRKGATRASPRGAG